jgi:hypothetical protein
MYSKTKERFPVDDNLNNNSTEYQYLPYTVSPPLIPRYYKNIVEGRIGLHVLKICACNLCQCEVSCHVT